MGEFDLAGRRVWVAGHRGMAGSAIVRRLATEDCEVLTVGREEVDLRDPEPLDAWMARRRPDVVFMAAGTVGGILANDSRPAEFIRDNVMIQGNVIHAAWRHGVAKMLLLGSSCIYPKLAVQPISEEALLTGPLEPTNQWYAVAKIAGVTMAQAYRAQYGCDFITAMPTNLYGPGDNFNLDAAHVLPALIRRTHEAKVTGAAALTVWGSGAPQREFLHVDDLADAAVHLIKVHGTAEPVNIGTGTDLSIRDLAELIRGIVGFEGELRFDETKPDGTPRKLLDVGRLTRLGWTARIGLADGVARTYRWFLENLDRLRR
ncbi:GDP-L-fucose synthase [Skermanella stibiiresistens SB22]|uniref:GDP-L-fucose synthase n=1 Tax=Skermanella stibiiresistens SB22 TaxID=1385369 RepID=W9GV90_9PROT|nr:GDP-L-fucose synthase [Skermanella stibiiresistens]EWY37810.1 GDP-L-fucose synthase [Skermanella stibiiresistens SB22]